MKTRQLTSADAQLFICSTRVGKIAALFEFVLKSDFEALREQDQIKAANVLELQTALADAHARLGSGELERLQDELEMTRQQRDSFSERAHAAERENHQLRSGETKSLLDDVIREQVAAFAAPATKTKGKAA